MHEFQSGIKAAALLEEKAVLVMSMVQRIKLGKRNKQTIRGSVCLKALILNPHHH